MAVCAGNNGDGGLAEITTAGNGFTNKVAAPEFTVVHKPFSNALKVLVFWLKVTLLRVSVALVAPGTFIQALPFHCCH